MPTESEAIKYDIGGWLLIDDVVVSQIITREDLSSAQQMFERIAEDFMRSCPAFL